MHVSLVRTDLVARLVSFAPEQYKYIYGIMKSVAL
jgi:hypothetical protein